MTSPSSPPNRTVAARPVRSAQTADRVARARRGRLVALGTMVAVFTLFGSIVWYAWLEREALGEAEVPLLRASREPWRLPPADPGGLPLPNADRPIGRLLEGKGASPQPERILPVEELDISALTALPSRDIQAAGMPLDGAAAPADGQKLSPARDAAPEVTRSLLVPPVKDHFDATAGGPVAPGMDRSLGPGLAVVEAEPAAGLASEGEEPRATAEEELMPKAAAAGLRPTDGVPTLEEAVLEAAPQGSAQSLGAGTGRLAEQSHPRAAAPGRGPYRPAAPDAGVRIQLAAVSRREGIEQQWATMQRRWPEVLGQRELAITPLERSGHTLWRIQASGFASSAEAVAACRLIRNRGGDCFVVGK